MPKLWQKLKKRHLPIAHFSAALPKTKTLVSGMNYEPDPSLPSKYLHSQLMYLNIIKNIGILTEQTHY